MPLVSTPENEELADGPKAQMKVESLSNDSRDIGPSCVFFCIEGYARDGHDFAAEAAAKGAIAVVASKKVDVGNPDVPVILVEDTQSSLAMASKAFYGTVAARPPLRALNPNHLCSSLCLSYFSFAASQATLPRS